METVEEKLIPHKSREQLIRDLAGWMSHDEAEELRQTVKIFDIAGSEEQCAKNAHCLNQSDDSREP
jgi:hypothetical protein